MLVDPGVSLPATLLSAAAAALGLLSLGGLLVGPVLGLSVKESCPGAQAWPLLGGTFPRFPSVPGQPQALACSEAVTPQCQGLY